MRPRASWSVAYNLNRREPELPDAALLGMDWAPELQELSPSGEFARDYLGGGVSYAVDNPASGLVDITVEIRAASGRFLAAVHDAAGIEMAQLSDAEPALIFGRG